MHYAIVISNTSSYLYVNGVLDKTATTPSAWSRFTNEAQYNSGFYIGGSKPDGGSQQPQPVDSSYTNFKSKIYDVRVYQSPLSSDKINIIYNKGTIGPTVTMIGNGSSTISASQGETTDYTSKTVTSIFTVSPKNPTIGTLSIPSKTYEDSPFSIEQPTSDSSATFTFTSSDTNVATIGATSTLPNFGLNATTTTVPTSDSTNTYTVNNYNSRVTAVSNGIGYVLSFPSEGNGYLYIGGSNGISNSGPLRSYCTLSFWVFYDSSCSSGNNSIVFQSQWWPTYFTQGKLTTNIYYTGDGPVITQTNTPTLNTWVHYAIVISNTSSYLYVNGVLDKTATTPSAWSRFTNESHYNSGFYIGGSKPDGGLQQPQPVDSSYTNFKSKIYDVRVYQSPLSSDKINIIYNKGTIGPTVTVIGGGTTTISANQNSLLPYYSSGIKTTEFTVGPKNITIGNLSIPSKTYGDSPFTISAPSSNSSGAFTFTSSNTNIAFISGNTITIVGTGTCNITATQEATTNYDSATTSALFTVGQLSPTIGSFSFPTKIFGDSPFIVTTPSSNSDGTFSYTSSDTNVATIFGNTITIVGTGTCIITATQSSTANYTTGSTTTSFSVKVMPTIGSFSLPTKRFGNSPFTVTAPSSDSSGAFTYTSSNTAIATVSGNTVTIVGSGTCTVTATQAETINYGIGTATATLTVNKANPTYGSFLIPNKTYGDTPFTVTAPSSNSDGLFSYTSSNTNVASISGTTVTVIGAGTCFITADQAETSNYLSSGKSATLTVFRANPTINFPNITKTIGDAPFTVTAPSSNSSGAFTYTSSNTAIASVSGNTITIIGSGICTITATQAMTPNYYDNIALSTLTVSSKSVPNITGFSVLNKTYGDDPFTITDPSSNSNGLFSYTSLDTSVATISGNTISIVGSGTCTVTATQEETDNYFSGEITASFTVSKSVSNITGFSVLNKTYGDDPFTITDPSSNSNGLFSYTSLDTSVATISGNTISIVGSGTCTVTATQAETDNYFSGETTASFTVSKAVSNITGFSVLNKTYGDDPFTITAPSSNRSGVFNYTSLDTSVATVSDNTISIVGSGTCIVTATQEETDNYFSGETTASFTVSKAVSNITGFSVLNKTYGDAPFTVTAPSSNRSGVFSYLTSDTSVATVSDNTISIVGAGTCIVTATQAETDNYFSGETTASFTVSKAFPSIGTFSLSSKIFGDEPFIVTAPSSTSIGVFSYVSSDTNVAIISGNTISIVGAGSCYIIASQAETSNYLSDTVSGLFTVNQANPTIGSFVLPSNKSYGDASFTITQPTSNSNGSFTYTSSNTNVASISGNTITIVGGGTCYITATQASTTNYTSGEVTSSFPVYQQITNVGNLFIPNRIYGDNPFIITQPSSNSNGAFTYTSSDTNVASISGTTVTVVGGGTCIITATQVSTTNYTAGSTTKLFTVNKAFPSIGSLSIPNKTYGDDPFTITQPSSKSDGAFTYTSSNTNVASISGTTVIVVGGGTCYITATQASTTNYTAGAATTSFTVNPQITSIVNFLLPIKTYGNEPFVITQPTSNSNGSFSYASSNTNIASIYNNTLTIIGAGTCYITAIQASTTNYTAGSATTSFTAIRANPSILDFPFGTKTYRDPPFLITQPISNSSGPFTYTSSDTNVAIISDNTITIVGAGNALITETESETVNYNSGIETELLIVNKANPGLGTFSIPTKTFGNIPFTITAPSSNSDGAFSYVSSDTSIASISGNVITIVSPGTCTVTVTQAETSNYLSDTKTTSFIVRECTQENPTIITTSEQLLYFIGTTAGYGDIEDNLNINYNLKSSFNKKIFTTTNLKIKGSI